MVCTRTRDYGNTQKYYRQPSYESDTDYEFYDEDDYLSSVSSSSTSFTSTEFDTDTSIDTMIPPQPTWNQQRPRRVALKCPSSIMKKATNNNNNCNSNNDHNNNNNNKIRNRAQRVVFVNQDHEHLYPAFPIRGNELEIYNPGKFPEIRHRHHQVTPTLVRDERSISDLWEQGIPDDDRVIPKLIRDDRTVNDDLLDDFENDICDRTSPSLNRSQ